MPKPSARSRAAIERLLATDYARDRVAAAFFQVVADGLDLGPCAVRTASERASVGAAVAGPIRRSTEVALGQLAAELHGALEHLPVDLVDRLTVCADASPLSIEAMGRGPVMRVGASPVTRPTLPWPG